MTITGTDSFPHNCQSRRVIGETGELFLRDKSKPPICIGFKSMNVLNLMRLREKRTLHNNALGL